jgi:hypothetical protein
MSMSVIDEGAVNPALSTRQPSGSAEWPASLILADVASLLVVLRQNANRI